MQRESAVLAAWTTLGRRFPGYFADCIHFPASRATIGGKGQALAAAA